MSTDLIKARLTDNLASIRQRINAAAERNGRSGDDVKLIAVTKYVDVVTTRALVEAGQSEIGESRPQVMWEKAEQLRELKLTWHLVGHLQRNKVKRTIECCSLIHSVDSERLLIAIDNASTEQKRIARCLLEINISGESAKHGIQPDNLESVLESAQQLSSVQICGLMGMASLSGSLSRNQGEFAHLRRLRDRFARFDNGNIALKELSMGMSGDFEAAITEGSTMVRIGSILFEGIAVER